MPFFMPVSATCRRDVFACPLQSIFSLGKWLLASPFFVRKKAMSPFGTKKPFKPASQVAVNIVFKMR